MLKIHVEDLNLSACTLVVRGGKSRREKAERRTVAISPHLRDYLVDFCADREPGEPLLRRRFDTTSVRQAGNSDVLREAWIAATEAGEVRREVWDPAGRRHARPAHAIRAGVIAFLRQAGVDRGVVKFLAGQSLDLQERYYLGDGALPLAHEAVKRIPAIDWGEAVADDNVIPIR